AKKQDNEANILLFGGILTSRSRTETFINLRKGDSARLPGGAKVVLVDLKYEQYPDGRPKSWESTVAIDKNPPPEAPAPVLTHEEESGDTLGTTGFADPTLNNSLSSAKASSSEPATSSAAPAAPAISAETGAGPGLPSSPAPSTPIAELPQYRIRVNTPLRLKGYSIYQQNWHTEKQVVLRDAMGMQFFLEPGMRETTKDGFVLFMALDTSKGAGGDAAVAVAATPAVAAAPSAIFLLEQNGKRTVVKAAPGEKIGSFTFSGYIDQPVSGLAVVSDKGYPFVAAGFILVILGVFITYIRKLKGMLA
ncbi:MAG: cytochrome c biogenesis protein ResB, partial [Spirochaetia bacterium]|nr:cytochrome c biogenesis protein ResB [Spirochaetia bacterium]